MSDDIIAEIERMYGDKLSEIKKLAQLYKDDILSKIDLSKKEINSEARSKSEVAP